MSRDSTIRDLRVKAKRLEAKRCEIDKHIEAIYTTIRTFEESSDTADQLLADAQPAGP